MASVARLLQGDQLAIGFSQRCVHAASLAGVLCTGVPAFTLAAGAGTAPAVESRAGEIDGAPPMPVAVTMAGHVAQTRTPASPTSASRPGLPETDESSASDDASGTASPRGQLMSRWWTAWLTAGDPASASAPTREVLLAVSWPEMPRRGRLPETIETATLPVREGDTYTVAAGAAPRTYGEFGIRPTVVDAAQGLVRVDILMQRLSQGTTPDLTVDESIDLVAGGEGVLSSRTGFTIAVTGIREMSPAGEAEYPPITPTSRPPGDTVRAPFPGSPALAERPGPPDPGVALAAVSQAPPAGSPMAIVMRIGLPGGLAEPVLTLASGTTGTLQLPDESSFGFRPTRFYRVQSRSGFPPLPREVVRVEILDLSTSPGTSLGVVDLSGGDTVRTTTTPSFTITLIDRATRQGR